MSTPNQQPTQYILYDVHTGYVITNTTIPAIADALMEGVTDIDVLAIHSHLLPDVDLDLVIKKKHVRIIINQEIWITAKPDYEFIESAPSSLEGIIDVVLTRKKYLEKFYFFVHSELLRHTLSSDLNLLCSLNGVLSAESYLVKEYGRITGVESESAYRELKMRVDSYMVQRMRVYAQFEVCKRRINQASTDGECKEVLGEMMRDTYVNF